MTSLLHVDRDRTREVPMGSPAGPPSSRPSRSRTRWRLIVCLGIVVAALGWIAVRGLSDSFVYYLTPTDIAVDHKAQVNQRVRLGGFVVPGTISRSGDTLTFAVTDGDQRMSVLSTGPVPRLFKPDEGIVLEGALGADGRFHSDTVLIKHDGNYRAPDDLKPPGGR